MNKKLKIAVITGLFPKISETFILTHIAALIDAGHDVTIFARDYKASEDIHPIFHKYNMKNKTVYRTPVPTGLKKYLFIPILFFKNLRYGLKLIKSFHPKFYGSYALKGYFFYDLLPFIKYKSFDIIHSHFGPNASKMAFIRQFSIMQGKHICTFHGHDLNDHREIKAQYDYKYLFNDLSAAICVVDFIKNKLIQKAANRFPIYKNPVSINTNKFTLKNSFSNGSKPINFITVGRVINWKGQLETVKAFASLKDNYPYTYTLIGDGPDLNKIKTFVKNNNLHDTIILKGSCPQDEVIEELQKADVHILYGLTDQYGNIDAQGTVVQEAQACGTPVIVSYEGGLPEGMIEKETGIIVRENDIDGLKDAITFFIKHPYKIKEMGRAGRQFVKDNYSNEVVYKRLFKIYNNILSPC
jgi:colanic acid/amylovoran biosynthesis glycosyltransferase